MQTELTKTEMPPQAKIKQRHLSILIAAILCWVWGGLTLGAAIVLIRTGAGQHFLEYFILIFLTGIGLIYAGWAAMKMRSWAGRLGVGINLFAAAIFCLFPIVFFHWIVVAMMSVPLTAISLFASNWNRFQNPNAPATNALPRFVLFEIGAIVILAAAWFWTAPRTTAHADEPGRFSRNSNGIVVDTITGLEWYLGPLTEWENANKWADELKTDGGGFRLPTSSELAGLYQKNPNGSHIDPAFTAPEKFNWVWTSARHDGYLVKLIGGSKDIFSMGGVYYFYSGGKGWNHIGPGHKCYAMAVRDPKSIK